METSSPSKVIVQLENISKVYGTGELAVHALAEVNLTIATGEYCAVMGASGSGKSTLMNVIACLDRPTAGRYCLDGTDVAQLDDRELAHIRSRKLGFVFQQFHLLAYLSALENVMMPLLYANVPPGERLRRARVALERVGLGQRLHSKPNQLSGGQQQRVAIARAIINQPMLLLADEPTGALDSHTTQEVLSIFRELHASGITVIMVTHEAAVARQTHRIIWLKDGGVIHNHASPDELGALVV